MSLFVRAASAFNREGYLVAAIPDADLERVALLQKNFEFPKWGDTGADVRLSIGVVASTWWFKRTELTDTLFGLLESETEDDREQEFNDLIYDETSLLVDHPTLESLMNAFVLGGSSADALEVRGVELYARPITFSKDSWVNLDIGFYTESHGGEPAEMTVEMIFEIPEPLKQ